MMGRMSNVNGIEPRATFVVGAVALAALGGCSGSDAGGGPGTTAPEGALTYYRDAKPIFDAKCATCHVEGGIAPFATTSYATLKDWAKVIKDNVVAKTMPPWLADDSCAEYVADRALSQDQIDLLAKWVDDGAYEGDPKDEGKPLVLPPSYALSRVDRTLEMAAAYTATVTPDEYRCFVLDWPETTTKFVTGFGANPGNPAVVHHVIAYIVGPDQVAQVKKLDDADDGPGYLCYGGPGLNSVGFLGGWAPGGRGNDFPAGTGQRIDAGSKIILQVHYNSLAAGVQPDQTSVDVKIEDKVEKEAWVQPWTNPGWISGSGMLIPAGQMDVTHTFSFDPTQYISDGQPFVIYSANHHMHTLGTTGKLWIDRQDGTQECLLDIPRWNFHWQNSYGFAKNKTFQPGDRLGIECHWDNTTAKDVTWGEGTTDEMCIGFFYLTK